MGKDMKSERRNTTDAPSGARPTPLSGYKRDKKVLTPPLATLENIVMSSWMNDRLPEMVWAILIRNEHPGDMGYAIFRDILRWLGDNMGQAKIEGVTHTDIERFDAGLRKKFTEHIVEVAGTDVLKPILLFPDLPALNDWKSALHGVDSDIEEDWGKLADAIADVLFHQTQQATDVRWVKLMGTLLAGNLHLPGEMLNKLNNYPNLGDQRSVRPMIRSSEMMEIFSEKDNEWPKEFWNFVQEETVCIPEVNRATEEEIIAKYEDVIKDKRYYEKKLPNIRQDLVDHFITTSKTTGIDARHESVIGIALYALDNFIESTIVMTAGNVSGRVTSRIIFEAYVTLAYLLHKEVEGEPIWDGYREYGSGQASLIERKYEEGNYKSSMVDVKVMHDIANEDKWTEYVPINVGNWDTSDLRKMSTLIGAKNLYDQYYSYTSGFVHANWAAVRESSMQACLNPLHRLHRIPSFGLPVLPNVNEDCRQMLNKIFKLVDRAYPGFKHQLRKQPAVRTKS